MADPLDDLVEKMIRKCLDDPDFAEKLESNTEEALKELGIKEPTKKMINAVRGLYREAQKIYKAFGVPIEGSVP